MIFVIRRINNMIKNLPIYNEFLEYFEMPKTLKDYFKDNNLLGKYSLDV